jgi:hypothetical protein
MKILKMTMKKKHVVVDPRKQDFNEWTAESAAITSSGKADSAFTAFFRDGLSSDVEKYKSESDVNNSLYSPDLFIMHS